MTILKLHDAKNKPVYVNFDLVTHFETEGNKTTIFKLDTPSGAKTIEVIEKAEDIFKRLGGITLDKRPYE